MTITPPRSGYTLIEVIFVMAILVAAAALAIPATQSMMVDARIRASADVVRARIADARASALEQGRPWRLGYLPGTGVFQLAPDDADDWNNTSQDIQEHKDLLRDHLPKDIVFAQDQASISNGDGAGAAGSGWQTIAVFLPEGNAKDDTTTYFGKHGIVPMRVTLRALTGTISVDAPTVVMAGSP